MATLQDLFQEARASLGDTPQAALEAKVLVLACSRVSEEQFLSRPDKEVAAAVRTRLETLLARRRSGVPLAYVTGTKEFWSLSFRIPRGVFIPRPETELVVESTLRLARDRKAGRILDIGTGSGNIAIALCKELDHYSVAAVDRSPRAIKTAQTNAARLGARRLKIIRSNLFSGLADQGLDGQFDFIVCNPPYVAGCEWANLEEGVRNFEPKRALVPGKTGLEFIRRLVRRAPKFLKKGGYLVLEVGAGQSREVIGLYNKRWGEIETVMDLAGIPRVIIARKLR